MKKIQKLILVAGLSVLVGCGGGGGSESASEACVAFKVFNGDECVNDSLPVVKLVRNGQSSCTGTIISDDVVLTAAHCLVSANKLEARHDRGVQSATRVLVNPMFGRGSRPQYDVGLVEFPGIAKNFGVTPARFGLSRPTQVGDVIRVIGYGFDGTSSLANDNPRGVSLTVQALVSGLIVTLFNADGQGACFGDSGGAATFDGKIVATVQGGGNDCAEGNENYFVDLALEGNYYFLAAAIPNVPLG